MDNIYIFNLIQPCKNRGVNITNNKDGSVTLDGTRFETMRECEDYLDQKPRLDLTPTVTN